jgi:ribosomal protein S24E
MEILEKTKNPLLKREEADILYTHKGKPTPSRRDLIKEISKELKSKEDLIIINKIHTIRGKNESRINAFVFSKKEDIPSGLLEASKKRMKEKKEKPPEEKPAEKEEPKEEAEEKKPEEPKEEEKKEEPKEKKPEEKQEEKKEPGEKKEDTKPEEKKE